MFSSVGTQSPDFVHDVNKQNKVLSRNIQHFYRTPISLSDPIHETLKTKHFILAKVSFYSTMIVLLFRAHPKMSIFLCHCISIFHFLFQVRANSFMNMKLVQVQDNWVQKILSISSLKLIFLTKKKPSNLYLTEISISSHKRTMQG